MEILALVFSGVFGLGGLLFGIITAVRNKKTDDKKDGKEDGIVLTELGYIKKGIDGIEKRLEKQENQYVDVVKHLTAVEESAKNAHKRIDKLEKYHIPN
jgi:DNA-binding FrmR family transcriptional regulator